MKRLLLIALMLCGSVYCYAKDRHLLQTAKVLSQNFGSYQAGAIVMPMGSGLVGGPLNVRASVVIVETEKYRYTWQESTRSPNWHHFLIVPVNGMVSFYQDGNYFTMLDARGKKHKFSLLHSELLPNVTAK